MTSSKLAGMSADALESVSGGLVQGRQIVRLAKLLHLGEATQTMSSPMMRDLGGSVRRAVHSEPFWKWGGIQSKARGWLGNESVGEVIREGLQAGH